MWCGRCHYGAETCNLPKGTKCPQCGGKFELDQRPFPEKKQDGKGSGKPRSSYRKPKEQNASSIETL